MGQKNNDTIRPIDKYIEAAKAASDSLAADGCLVSGLTITTALGADGVPVQSGKVALEIYVPAPND